LNICGIDSTNVGWNFVRLLSRFLMLVVCFSWVFVVMVSIWMNCVNMWVRGRNSSVEVFLVLMIWFSCVMVLLYRVMKLRWVSL